MKQILESALLHLERANFVGYFDEMDKLQTRLPAPLKTLYATYKGEFMAGKNSCNFHQQIAVFAKQVLQNDTPNLPPTGKENLAQQAEKIYNIENIQQATFNKEQNNVTANTYIKKIGGKGHIFNF